MWSKMKKSNLLPGENRNAIRLDWKRPVYILTPIKKPAQAINVSASGILIKTLFDEQLEMGQTISLSIPHAYTKETTTVHGKIARMIRLSDWLQIGIDFIN